MACSRCGGKLNSVLRGGTVTSSNATSSRVVNTAPLAPLLTRTAKAAVVVRKTTPKKDSKDG